MPARRVIARAIVPEDLVHLRQLAERRLVDVAAEVERIVLPPHPAGDLPQRVPPLANEWAERAGLCDRRVRARRQMRASHEVLDRRECALAPRLDDLLTLDDLDALEPAQAHAHRVAEVIARRLERAVPVAL